MGKGNFVVIDFVRSGRVWEQDPYRKQDHHCGRAAGEVVRLRSWSHFRATISCTFLDYGEPAIHPIAVLSETPVVTEYPEELRDPLQCA